MSVDILPPEDNNQEREQSSSDRINEPKEFNIQIVETSPKDSSTNVEKGGVIDLGKRLDPLTTLERFEMLRVRKFLTYAVFLLSAGWLLTGLIYYLKTGNSYLIDKFPPMSYPIIIILGYYFGEQLVQKYIHRGFNNPLWTKHRNEHERKN